ncbi:hypothetical protein [Nostoc sp. ChiVER01]|nr:hypothetical protein [Nostoc sp. ChiVER01]MDZ8227287.1 hypothetical protein [Nostoc sp. ChiVER01]
MQSAKLVDAIIKIWGSGDGERANLAQADGRNASKLPEALPQA